MLEYTFVIVVLSYTVLYRKNSYVKVLESH